MLRGGDSVVANPPFVAVVLAGGELPKKAGEPGSGNALFGSAHRPPGRWLPSQLMLRTSSSPPSPPSAQLPSQLPPLTALSPSPPTTTAGENDTSRAVRFPLSLPPLRSLLPRRLRLQLSFWLLGDRAAAAVAPDVMSGRGTTAPEAEEANSLPGLCCCCCCGSPSLLASAATRASEVEVGDDDSKPAAPLK